MRFPAFAAIVLAIVAATAAAEPPAPVELDSVTAITAAILPRLEELRGLRFLQPIPVRVESDSAARVYFAARLTEDTPPESLRVQGRAAELLALLPPGYDLQTRLLDLLQEQAAGYYDPERKAFIVLGDMPRAVARTIVAHELTHGLDDQHFDLAALVAAQPDDDHTAALGSLIEGSATAVMSRFVAEEIAANRMSMADLQAIAATDAGRADVFDAAPPMIQRSLMGSYILGMNFVLQGNPLALLTVSADDLNRAFRNPPRSSEQILHPEKYWDESHADEPRALPHLEPGPLLGPGWQTSGSGVLGELLMALLTDPEPAPVLDLAARGAAAWTNPAAAGWGGDRWWLFEKAGAAVVVLGTVWDTEPDAVEFAAAVRKPAFQVERSGPWVVVVAGAEKKPAAAAARAALKALRAGSGARP